MKNRKITLLVVLSFLFLLIFGTAYTYSVFQSSKSGNMDVNIAAWNIILNDSNVVETHTFSLNDLTINKNDNVKDSTFAPGSTGYFNINIDPSDTQVAIKYEIVVKPFEFEIDGVVLNNENLRISRATVNGSDITNTTDGRFVGVIPYKENRTSADIVKLYVEIEWVNEESNNEMDSIIGFNGNVDADIPMEINFSQYLGEDLN